MFPSCELLCPNMSVIADELATLKQELTGDGASSRVRLDSAFAQLVRVTIVTPLHPLSAAFHPPDQYPEEPLGVDLSSTTLDAELVAKLVTGVEKEVGQAQYKGKPQVLVAVRWLERFCTANRLLSCFAEVKKLKQLLPDPSQTLKLSEKSGRITASLTQGSYAVQVQLTIPADSPTLAVIRSNFSSRLTEMFSVQARELMRRMKEGFTSELARREEDEKLRPSAKIRAKLEPKIDLSSGGLAELKSDREFLNQYSQVRTCGCHS
jgi:hypothetical protein